MNNDRLDMAQETLTHFTMSRRRLLKMVGTTTVIAGVTPLLAACGEDDDDTTTPEASGPDAAGPTATPEDEEDSDPTEDTDEEEEPEATEPEDDDSAGTDGRQGGELVIANEQSPVSLDPHFIRDVGSSRAMFYMYDPLVRIALDTSLEPGLATSWEISEDGMEYLLVLEENVTFHDGTPFNADAVVFNLERQMDESVSTNYYDDFVQYVESVEAVDEFTVRINMNEVYALFDRDFLAFGSGQMVSPTAVQDLGNDEFAQRPVGTGPFKFQEFERDSHLVMVRNDDYWQGTPNLDSIRVRIIPEQSVQIVEQEAGNVQLVFSVQAKDIERLENAGVQIVNQPAVTGTFISMNLAKGVTQEMAVRQAIAYSFDREAVVSELLLGYGQVSRGGSPEGWPRYHADIPMDEFDPEEAARILDEAGWVAGSDGVRERDGERLRVNVLSTQLERALSYGLMNQIIQQSLENIGFETEMQTMEWGAYLDEFRAGEFWEVSFHAQNASAQELVGGTLDPDGYWNVNQHAKATDPELVEVADRIREIYDNMNQTLDPDERIEQWKEVQMLIQEHQLISWLVHWDSLVGLDPAVRDLGVKAVLSDTLYGIHETWLDT